jgi:hypothetical protein
VKKLTLRQEGTRNIVSDGENDLGHIREAHLKSYVASLPGSQCGMSCSGVRVSFSGPSMEELTLRRDGDRHIVTDGKNDFGEIEDGHLKEYTMKLPGAYYEVPPQAGSVTAAGQRPGGMSRSLGREAITLSRGEARQNITQAVEVEKKRLLSRDHNLTELEAHRLAMQRVAAEEPSLLAAYRADVQEV